MNAIILHGTGASPEGNWFRWLEGELRQRGWQVWVPTLPGASRPSGRRWVAHIVEHAPFHLGSDTVVIGHSAGAVAALLLAQHMTAPLRGIFAVGAFPNNDFLQWDILEDLFDEPFQPEDIRRGTQVLVFVHADNDPYCPLQYTQELCERVGGELLIAPGQGHFNLEVGPQYATFPQLLSLIEQKTGTGQETAA